MTVLNNIKHTLKAILKEARPVVSLKPEGEERGRVLLSYITAPFLVQSGQPIPSIHSNYWEVRQIAKTFLDRGYGVDVIDWNNQTFKPRRDYSFCIDVHNLERLAPLLNKDCIKVLHIAGAHWLSQNSAEYGRLLALQRRRGITLSPRRTVPPSLGIEHADYAAMLGNDFTIRTFSYARKEIHRIPIPSTALYPWSEDKDYDAQRNRFLWFGSVGMVHKGLDLVLEAFARMPKHHLTVCGPVDQEKDFESAYDRELYHTSNIATLGWVDTDSSLFSQITKTCVALVYPSCSEGASAGVVTCLHAGLIPVLTYESGIDVGDFGFLLKDPTVEEIIESVNAISSFSASELKERSRKAWEYSRAYHTRENYVACYQDFVTNVLGIQTRG